MEDQEVEVPLRSTGSLFSPSDIDERETEIMPSPVNLEISNRKILPIFHVTGRNDREITFEFTMSKKIESIRKSVRIKRKVLAKKKKEVAKPEESEEDDELPLNDTIDTFLNSQTEFNKLHLKGHNLRYEARGSPFKRSVIGSVEMFDKEKVKRTSALPTTAASNTVNVEKQEEVKINRLNNLSKRKPKSPEKKSEKVPSFIMTRFSDSDLKKFIAEYMEKKHMKSYNEALSICSSGIKKIRNTHCLSVEKDNRDSRYLENYEKTKKQWQKYADQISRKIGKKSPEYSLINTTDFYIENLQK